MVRPPLAPAAPRPTDSALLRNVRAGDDAAAAALFARYARRLRRLVAARCPPACGGRFDADDVVQSAFRAVFARADTYAVPAGKDVWGLLVAVAVNKVRTLVAHHTADKRAVRTTAGHTLDDVTGRDEAAAAVLRLVLDEQLAALPDDHRAVVRLRMDGHEVADIAARTGRSARTVERVLRQFRDALSAP